VERSVKGKFVQFPQMWEEQLAKVRAGGCAYRVALYLLKRARWQSPGNRQITLSTTTLRKLGVSRDGKRSALQQLRRAGLIRVEERPKKSPIVTVRFVD
jgi:hypothetical protein